MGATKLLRVLFGTVIGLTGMALAAPLSSVGAGAASTVTVYAPATVGVVAPTTGPTAAPAGQTVTQTRRGARSASAVTNSAAAAALATASGATNAVVVVRAEQLQRVSSNDSRRPISTRSSSRRTRGSASATGSCSSRSTRHTGFTRPTARRSTGPTNVNDLFDRGTRRSSPAIHAATTTRRRTLGSPRSCSSAAVRPRTASRRSLDIAVNSLRQSREHLDPVRGRHDPPRRSRMPVLRRPADPRDRPVQPVRRRPTSSRSSARSSTVIRCTPSPRRTSLPACPLHFAHFSHLSIGGSLARIRATRDQHRNTER